MCKTKADKLALRAVTLFLFLLIAACCALSMITDAVGENPVEQVEASPSTMYEITSYEEIRAEKIALMSVPAPESESKSVVEVSDDTTDVAALNYEQPELADAVTVVNEATVAMKDELALEAAMEQYGITDEVLKIYAKLVASEAYGEPYEGKVAVAAVVLNRDEHGGFGKNPNYSNPILALIYAPGQFYGVGTPLWNAEPNEECIQAVKDALMGEDPSLGAIYFRNENKCAGDWGKYYELTIRIGDHWFYK